MHSDWRGPVLRCVTTLTSLLGLKYLHQPSNFVLNILAQKLICKSIFFTNIVISRNLKFKQTFAIVCSFFVNKLRATDSTISPGLINKVNGIYISFLWFRFTHMGLALRVLFHRFQIIFDRIRLDWTKAYWIIILLSLKIPRQKNPTLPLRSRHMERETKVHMAYSRAHMFVTSYHMSQLTVPVY